MTDALALKGVTRRLGKFVLGPLDLEVPRGGVTALACKKAYPVYLDETATLFDVISLDPTMSSLATVSRSATLGGATVNAVFVNGSYISKTYTILSASGGVSGTFAPTVVNSNLPANFATSLSYDATHAYLDLSLNYTPGPTAQSRHATDGSGDGYESQAAYSRSSRR